MGHQVQDKISKDLRCHVSNSANATLDHIAFRDFHRQSKVRYANMTVIIQEYVLRLAVPVDDALLVKVLQATDELSCVEPGTVHVEASLRAHVVDVELEVTTVHDGQHEA